MVVKMVKAVVKKVKVVVKKVKVVVKMVVVLTQNLVGRWLTMTLVKVGSFVAT